MKTRSRWLALLLPLWLLGGCAIEPELPTVEFVVDGTVERATLFWRDGAGLHQAGAVDLPWRVAFEAKEGTPVMVLARSANLNAGLWIQIKEDGEPVRSVPGCLCDGESVSVQADGVVGRWGE
ncbi:MAG: hypothetical protein WC326_11800 [Candidatus Delongbacteria bacterium]